MNYVGIAMVVGLSTLLASCAGPQRPVLYPNEKLTSVGKEGSQISMTASIVR
jgi:hypothetical protein